MKNPILAIGFLFFAIFLMKYAPQLMEARKEKLIPYSCRAVQQKLKKRIPANWKSSCEKNNLVVNINYPQLKEAKDMKIDKVRALLYRELANYLIQIAKNSPTDNLERTDIVRVHLLHPKMAINAVTEGKYIVKLATIKTPEMIKEHLKVTVQVQEQMIK